MSNGNVLERLWKLEAMVNKLVLDGKRDPERVCDVLQKIIQESQPALAASDTLVPAPKPAEQPQVPVEPLKSAELSVETFFQPIGVLNLSSNILGKLVRRKVRLIGELVQLTVEQLRSCQVLSAQEIGDVHAALAAHGLQLSMELSRDLRVGILFGEPDRQISQRRPTEILCGPSENKEERRCELCPTCGDRGFRISSSVLDECSCRIAEERGPSSHPIRKAVGSQAIHRCLRTPGQADKAYHGFTRDN